MNRLALALLLVLFLGNALPAQNPSAQSPPAQSAPVSPAPAKPAEDYSGMYAFLQEGEFVQLSVEDDGSITGFISRYGEGESDHGVFLDQFFKEGKLEGKNLSFTTKTLHDTWYEFKGAIERGEGKKVGDEGYFVLKGKLTQFTTDASKKTSSKLRDVSLKSFPQDLGDDPAKP